MPATGLATTAVGGRDNSASSLIRPWKDHVCGPESMLWHSAHCEPAVAMMLRGEAYGRHGNHAARDGGVGAVDGVAAAQVLRAWRTRSAGDISALCLTIALASMMLWMGYGALIGASAVVWANALTAL
jgi:hypothetical protein